MDVSKFKTSDWLKIGGGALMLIAGFLNWVKVSGFGVSSSGGNAFDFFFTGTIPWLLVVAAGVISVLLASGTIKPGKLPWTLILLAATGLAAVLLLLRILFNPIEGKDSIEALGGSVGRGIGMYLSFIAAAVALAGSVMGFKESGGDLNDLKDINKIKAAFDQGDGSGGSTPPPPPPPPAPPAPPAG